MLEVGDGPELAIMGGGSGTKESARSVEVGELGAVAALQPRDGQANFVAPNVFSIAEVYVEPGCTPLALVAEGQPVDFTLICRETDPYPFRRNLPAKAAPTTPVANPAAPARRSPGRRCLRMSASMTCAVL